MSASRIARLAALTTLAAALSSSVAFGQSSACADGQKLLQERTAMIQSLAPGKAKPTPAQACSRFSALVSNGQKLVAWIEANGAWCNVPEQITTRIKDDHVQAQKVRGQACNVAAQQKKMEARARAQAQQNAGNPFSGGGGDIVSGQMRVPAGAL